VKLQTRFFTLLLFLIASLHLFAQTTAVRYKVSFPHVTFRSDRGERIYFVKAVMQCGRFVAINSIPDDWSATLVGPVSEKTHLEMEAGHGTSALWHSEDLDGFLTILVFPDSSCFDITASITAASYYDGKEHPKKISFKQHELILKQVPMPHTS
jgi:hypothetical protein